MAWLYAQISALWSYSSSWIGNLSSSITYYYNRGKDFAESLYNSARSLAYSIRDYVLGVLHDADRALNTYISVVYNAARNYALDLYDKALAWFADHISPVYTYALNLYNSIKSQALAWVEAAKVSVSQYAYSLFATLLPKVAAIDQWINGVKITLTSFASSPLAFILGALEPVVVTWISELVGYGLGSVATPLPHRSDFGSGGGGGGGGYGGTPTPGTPAPGGSDFNTRFGRPPASVIDAIKSHFPDGQWNNAAEVSYMESGWNAHAVADTRDKAGGKCNQPYVTSGGINALTELSVGLFQINVCAHGGDVSYWSDPEHNVSKAASLYNASGKWTAWRISAGRLGLPY